MSEIWPNTEHFIWWDPSTRREIQWVIATADKNYQKRRFEDIIRRWLAGESVVDIARSWNITGTRVYHLIKKYKRQSK